MPRLPNETDHEYKARVIDPKSASFCAAKWYNATIWLGSGMTTSCHHPLPHKIDVEEVKKITKRSTILLKRKNNVGKCSVVIVLQVVNIVGR